MATFVLCHGAWAGGWQWRTIPDLLHARGHHVFTPTFTGLGERVHLARPDVELDTYITDIANVILFEELHDVVLVGYSYSGLVITGVADRIPERLAHLVYLDGVVPQNGQSGADLAGPEITAQLLAVTEQQGEGWKVPFMPVQPGTPVDSRFTPQPVKSMTQPITLQNPAGLALPRSFILCTEGKEVILMGAPILQAAQAAKSDPAWDYYELHSDHGPIENIPQELADLLHTIATQTVRAQAVPAVSLAEAP